SISVARTWSTRASWTTAANSTVVSAPIRTKSTTAEPRSVCSFLAGPPAPLPGTCPAGPCTPGSAVERGDTLDGGAEDVCQRGPGNRPERDHEACCHQGHQHPAGDVPAFGLVVPSAT